MKLCRWLFGAAAALLAASSGPVIIAAGDERGGPAYTAVDAATGTTIRVYRHDGRIALDVDHPTIQIRKELTDGRSVTTLRTGAEQLVVSLTRDAIVVADASGTIRGDNAHLDEVRRARTRLADSPLVSRAARLLGSLRLPGETPLKQTLLSTRALLLDVLGTAPDGMTAVERTTRALIRPRPAFAFTRVAGTATDPTECWEAYSKEAIATFMELEECWNDEEWWDLLGRQACWWIYELRAIGAFAWWLSCVGLNG